MASPLTSLPVLQIRRAKKSKHCSQCFGRIEAGTRYLLVDPWNWVHIWHATEARS